MERGALLRDTRTKFLFCKSNDLSAAYQEGQNIQNEPILETILKENVQFDEGMIPDYNNNAAKV